MTAEGDIIYGGSSGTGTRLGKGSDADVLTLASGVPTWATPTTGDITGVTAGVGLSGGGNSGALTITLDLSELSTVTPADGDFFSTLDSDGANEQKTTTTALATLFAGAGMTATSSVLNVIGGTGITANANDIATDASQGHVTTVGALDAGSITSGFTSIDVGSGGLTTTGAIAGGTIDASTDFTIGDTVITDGVITDTSGLQIAAAVDLVANTLTTTGSLQVRTIDYTDGDLAMTIADGGGVTFAQDVTMAALKTITLGDEGQVRFSDDLPAADDSATGIVYTMTALTGIAIGELVHMDANGKLDEAHADATADMPAIGIALTANASGSDAEIDVLLHGIYKDTSAFDFTPGLAVYVSDGTEGLFTQTAPSSTGDFVQRVGVALTADTILFNPSVDIIEHA
jgi:hypothetical protein